MRADRHLDCLYADRYVYGTGFTHRVVGVPKAESDALLNLLFHQLSENPDFQVRFRWEPNSIAIWDNRVRVAPPYDRVRHAHGGCCNARRSRPTLRPSTSSHTRATRCVPRRTENARSPSPIMSGMEKWRRTDSWKYGRKQVSIYPTPQPWARTLLEATTTDAGLIVRVPMLCTITRTYRGLSCVNERLSTCPKNKWQLNCSPPRARRISARGICSLLELPQIDQPSPDSTHLSFSNLVDDCDFKIPTADHKITRLDVHAR